LNLGILGLKHAGYILFFNLISSLICSCLCDFFFDFMCACKMISWRWFYFGYACLLVDRSPLRPKGKILSAYICFFFSFLMKILFLVSLDIIYRYSSGVIGSGCLENGYNQRFQSTVPQPINVFMDNAFINMNSGIHNTVRRAFAGKVSRVCESRINAKIT